MENSVRLLNYSGLRMVDRALGVCYAYGPYEDEEQRNRRIERVCVKHDHASMLRFLTCTFEVELSTSALLEWTRHQIGIDYAVQSTRYTIRKTDLDYIPSNNVKVNNLLAKHMEEIKELIKSDPDIKNDDLKLLLPQAYMYKMIVQMNGQAIRHFYKLRASKAAHYHIRDLARKLLNVLPAECKFIFEDLKVSE